MVNLFARRNELLLIVVEREGCIQRVNTRTYEVYKVLLVNRLYKCQLLDSFVPFAVIEDSTILAFISYIDILNRVGLAQLQISSLTAVDDIEVERNRIVLAIQVEFTVCFVVLNLPRTAGYINSLCLRTFLRCGSNLCLTGGKTSVLLHLGLLLLGKGVFLYGLLCQRFLLRTQLSYCCTLKFNCTGFLGYRSCTRAQHNGYSAQK